MKAIVAASAVAAVMIAVVPTSASAWWHRPYAYGWRMQRWGYGRPHRFAGWGWGGGGLGWGRGFGGGTYGGYNFTGGAQTMTGGPSGGTGS